MIKLKLSLEYHCYPLWIYSEKDDFIDNNFPKVLEENKEIDIILDEIQEEFDRLFVDNEIEFKYIGFQDALSKEVFSQKVQDVEKMIHEALGSAGILVNKIDVVKL